MFVDKTYRMVVRQVGLHLLACGVRTTHVSQRARRFLHDRAALLVALFALQALCYSYFFTAVIFSNHTFPGTRPYAFPSFKTNLEGRWFADLLILFQGRSGVQPVMMVAAAALQAVNGVLLGHLVGLRGFGSLFATGAVLCLFPAFADYYSFTIDHLAFVCGDTFALLGTLLFVRGRITWARVAGTGGLYVLALACYQPKIALVCFMAGIGILLRFQRHDDHKAREDVATMLSSAGGMAAAIVAASAISWMSARLLITLPAGARNHVNSLPELLEEIPAAYRWFWPAMTVDLGGLPARLSFFPAAGMLWGMLMMAVGLFRKGVLPGLAGLGLLALIPLELDAAHLVNSLTWDHCGRITAACGYCLAFFLGYGLRSRLSRYPCGVALAASGYCFAILAMQTTNAAMFKTIYDVNSVNRLVARVEQLGDGPATRHRPLVIVGNFPPFRMEMFVRYPTRAHGAHVFTDSFAEYRQPDILNFFMGVDAFRPPTRSELERAIGTTGGKNAWPQEDSVYLAEDTVVVLLEPYHPDVLVTRPTP